jgi:hypothetical protein
VILKCKWRQSQNFFHLSNWQFSKIIFDVREGGVKWLHISMLVEIETQIASQAMW